MRDGRTKTLELTPDEIEELQRPSWSDRNYKILVRLSELQRKQEEK